MKVKELLKMLEDLDPDLSICVKDERDNIFEVADCYSKDYRTFIGEINRCVILIED